MPHSLGSTPADPDYTGEEMTPPRALRKKKKIMIIDKCTLKVDFTRGRKFGKDCEHKARKPCLERPVFLGDRPRSYGRRLWGPSGGGGGRGL